MFNLQATFLLEFLLNFAGGLVWQRSGHPTYFGSLGLKIMLWGVKNIKNFDNFHYCLCSSCRAHTVSFRFILYLLVPRSVAPMGNVTEYSQKLGMGVHDNENQPGVSKKITRI